MKLNCTELNYFHIIVIATITTQVTTVTLARIMQLLQQQPHLVVYWAIVYRVWTENSVSFFAQKLRNKTST